MAATSKKSSKAPAKTTADKKPSAATKKTAAKGSSRKAKSYTVVDKVPGVFEADDGSTVVFHEIGAEVDTGQPGVERALELWPDCFEPA